MGHGTRADRRATTVSGWRQVGLFVTAAVLFGGTFVAAKAGLAYLPPLLFVAVRFDIGAVVLAVYAAAALSWEDLQPRTMGDVVGIVATGGIVIGLTNTLLFVGQQYTTSGVASIVFSLNPILTPVFAAFFLSDESVSAHGVAGMGLGLVGVVLVADPAAVVAGDGWVGPVVLFGGAVASALGAVVIRRADATLSSTARTVWGVPLAAALSHSFSVAAGESLAAVTVTPTVLVTLAYVGVFSGAVAYLAYFAVIDAAGATRANLVFYAIPLVSTVGGWLLLGESISERTLVGFAIVLAGFLLVGGDALGEWARQTDDRVRETVSDAD